MKIGTFVVGGIAGAAIVMMIQRNQMMSAVAASVGQSIKQRMNGMKDDAIEKALNVKFASSFNRAKDSKSSDVQTSSSNESGLGQIGQMIAQDAGVNHEVNAILEQNGQHLI